MADAGDPRNVATLRGDGVIFVGPADGDMACGEYGPGRMSEPLDDSRRDRGGALRRHGLALCRRGLRSGAGALEGRRVVVTSGPTHEPIDPVRYIANRSSGKQGHAIAAAARAAGASVTLVSGPVALADPPGVDDRHVETARRHAPGRRGGAAGRYFRRRRGGRRLESVRDGAREAQKGGRRIAIADAGRKSGHSRRASGGATRDRPALVVGFAAETEMLIEHAQEKRLAKGCDLIVANDVGAAIGRVRRRNAMK